MPRGIRSPFRISREATPLSACALGAAAPAHAEPTSQSEYPFAVLSTTKQTAAFSSPRPHTGVVAEFHVGKEVLGLCHFQNDGLDWVKVQDLQRQEVFGFVLRDAVDGAVDVLPRECPSELETIVLPAGSTSFASPAWGVQL